LWLSNPVVQVVAGSWGLSQAKEAASSRRNGMAYRYSIHPSIGVARVGNSPEGFYLAPEQIGELPRECDPQGNESGERVRRFKDSAGRVKRQAAQFRVYAYEDTGPGDPATELTAQHADIAMMEWTVHLANKKAAWYTFQPLLGDNMLSSENTYQEQHVPLRNMQVTGLPDRRKLIIDPGPRKLTGPNQRIPFTREFAGDYCFVSYPKPPEQGHPIETLGELRTDSMGRLLVLGGYGYAGGDNDISGYGGADTWNDDISDGPVTCRITFKDGREVVVGAWVLVGAPKVAPELVNFVTLDDLIFDVAVRFQNLIPELCYRDPNEKDPYKPGDFNPDYAATYERDIEPIIRRPLDYVWVSDVPSMVAFAAPSFDPKDNSEQNRTQREAFFGQFRRPGWDRASQRNDLFAADGEKPLAPLMPLNSGSNPVANNPWIDKFLTLTETQYFLLGQWAAARFTAGSHKPLAGVHELDRASVGNCVGAPMCPGIEVTWNLRNPRIYETPYRIRSAHPEAYYAAHGLDPWYDETLSGQGCEPGDLTKRMAIPWQADFFNCIAQFINFSRPDANQDASYIPIPPTYFTYWWPPQSPVYTIANPLTPEKQREAGIVAGYQVYYQRGLNSYADVIEAWFHLPFIVNQNTSPAGRLYPYFIESERDDSAFGVADVAVGGQTNLINPQDQIFSPFWYLAPYDHRMRIQRERDPEARVGAPLRRPRRVDRR
jgi:hypothetical protein